MFALGILDEFEHLYGFNFPPLSTRMVCFALECRGYSLPNQFGQLHVREF